MTHRKPYYLMLKLIALMLAVHLTALPVLAGSSLASGKVNAPAANLEVEILESNSDFVNYIYLVSPGPDLLIGSDEATGTIVPLPTVSPNQELIFEIRVFESDGVTDTGLRWQSGPPARNADHERHVQLSAPATDQIQVNFEDIHGDGWGIADEPNYVDAIFIVRPAS
jgi:hypothetical protein